MSEIMSEAERLNQKAKRAREAQRKEADRRRLEELREADELAEKAAQKILAHVKPRIIRAAEAGDFFQDFRFSKR